MEIIKGLNKFRNIEMNQSEHSYRTRDGTKLKSVTALIKEYSQPFNSFFVSKAIAKKRNIDRWEVIKEWDKARIIGNNFHKYIEDSLNKIDSESSFFVSDRFLSQFEDFYKRYIETDVLIPITSEFIVGSEKYKVAGRIDQIFLNTKTNKLHIYDWKTSRKMQTKSSKRFKSPMKAIKESKFNKYALQLSIYRYLIEQNLDESLVGESYIVWFSEDNSKYEILLPPYFKEEVKWILNINGNIIPKTAKTEEN